MPHEQQLRQRRLGERPDNGIGVYGVAPDARLLAVKVLDEDGGAFGDIAKGIRYAVDNGADVRHPRVDSGALCVTATDSREAPAAYSNLALNYGYGIVDAAAAVATPVS